MAIVQVDSEIISNIKTGTLNDSRVDGGRIKRKVGIFTIDTTDDAGSTYRVFRIPSDAIIIDMRHFTVDGITGLSAENWGLYDIDDGPVVDEDLLVDGRTMATPSPAGNIQVGRGNGFTEASRVQQIWERIGLSADPHKEYDVVLTLQNNAGSTATAGFQITYTDG